MGFAAEIKEFLGAAKDSWKLMSDTGLKDAQAKYTDVKAAAEQKEMDDPLNQQLKEAKLAHMKAQTGQIGRLTPLQQLQMDYYRQLLEAQKNPPEVGPSTAVGAPNTAYGGKPAAPRPDPEEIPAIGGGFKKGGLVHKFAVGGLVDDDDLAPDDDEPYVPAPAIGPTDVSAQSRAPTPAVGGVPMPRPKPNVLTDALKYGANQLPPNNAAIGAPPGARQRALRGYAQGAGGAPQEDMVKIYRKIDPNGEMGESERNLHAMQAVYNYKVNMGQPEEAAKAAFQMLQTYKTAATRYAALAKAAMDGGHVDEGLKLAMKAYANVPDGNDMKLYRGKDGSINWEAKDKDGKTISGGIATPDEIGTAAARLATPGQYENYVMQAAAGAKIKGVGGAGKKAGEEEDTAAGGFKTSKPTDYKELKQEQVDSAVDKWNEAQQKDPESKGKALTPKELASTKNMLFHVRANNQVTDDEGLRRIQTLITAAAPTKKGDVPPFTAVENKEDKTHTLRFPDGGELVIPNTQLGMFRTARAEHFQQVAKEAKKAAEDAARPSGLGQAWEATKGVASDIAEDVSKRAGAVAEANPEFAARAGSAARDVKHLTGEAADWLKKQVIEQHPFAGGQLSAPLAGTTGDVYGGVNRAVGGAARAVGNAVVPPATAYEINPEDRPL